MKKRKKTKFTPEYFEHEQWQWLKLTPRQRMLETTKLWKFYLAMGGRLDAESDPQSPFYFKEISS